jgi:hypothetical protein
MQTRVIVGLERWRIPELNALSIGLGGGRSAGGAMS